MTDRVASRSRLLLALWLGYVALVAALSLWPLPPGPDMGWRDKAVHLGMYLVMGLAVPWPVDRSRAWRSLVLLAAVGATLEALQEAMGLGRHGDVVDGLANIMGAALGLAVRLALHFGPEEG